ncbi:hypothetical protein OV207_19585 [Corallococcus sp. BB11-1]|uniref:hypothetical protein n=1 Tax=Corallococcus sp. BB11-1 TaxID=2996783 RepID=UPI00226D7858|nr:hypothetical protein [Corallococcus sp. BB11-1]MCY1033662.1 hypothetical protein [Corallococcus sp. BB11-1]
MKRSNTLLGLGLGLALLGSAPAVAGGKFSFPVTINTSVRWASGLLSEARNSADSVQRITITINATTTSEIGMVFFQDAAGTMAICTTQNPILLAVMKTARSDAGITAQWDVSGICTHINVDNSSTFSPKLP